MSLEQDLLSLKSKSEKLTALRIENATRLQGLNQEKDKLLAEAEALGIAPDKIEEVLKAEEAALAVEIAKLETELSQVLEQVSGL
jgi:septal ring factor EnvC (AmiA/AmiB activator)